jgi:hypothetical protein
VPTKRNPSIERTKTSLAKAKLLRPKVVPSEACTRKARHPERSEAELKDLHSSQPSTTLMESKYASHKARSVENGTKYSEGQGFSPAVKAATEKGL